MGWLNNSYADLDQHWGLGFIPRALKYQNRDQIGTNFAKMVPIGTDSASLLNPFSYFQKSLKKPKKAIFRGLGGVPEI